MSLGIDIGKYSIKIVELEKSNDIITLKNYGYKNTVDDLSTFDLEKINKSQLIACIQDLCKEMKINPKKIKNVVTSLSNAAVDVRQITTLDLPDDELSVSLEMEAKKHIALDGTDPIIDYHHLGSHNTELDKINLILVSTTKNIITEHADMIKSSGFKPHIFDTDPVAISNIYQHSYELPEDGTDVILNFGNTSTNLIVWGKNSPFFSRNLEIGGDKITKEIMRIFNVDYKSAEEKKFSKGTQVFDEQEEQEELASAISIEKKTIFNELTEDIRKTLRYYMKNNNQSFFNTFYLSGGASLTPGIEEFIVSNLNVKVEMLNPLINISTKKDIDEKEKYAQAIGLALRGLE